MRSTFNPWKRFSKHQDFPKTGHLISPSKLAKVNKKLAFAATAMNGYIYNYIVYIRPW